MTLFDYAVLAIIGLSILLSVMRGFLREVLALLAWVVGFWLATLYAGEMAQMLPAGIPTPQLRLLAGFVLVFFAVFLVMTVLSITVGQFLKVLGLGPWDRMLGAAFGLARGILIVLAGVVVAGLTTLPKQEVWRDAMFSAPLEAVVVSAKPWLPEAIRKELRYE
jgi:membrane protein required for colicin V production